MNTKAGRGAAEEAPPPLPSIEENIPAKDGDIPSKDVSSKDGSIPSRDRERILAEIERTVAKSKIEIKPDTFSYTSKRTGTLLPILVNVAAFLIIFIAASLLIHFFDKQEVSIAKSSANILSAEGKVLEAFKEESEKILQEKDREILDIQARLAEARKERERLRLQSETKLSQRENELRLAFEQGLDAEQERLRQAGLSDKDLESRLGALETERRNELERELAQMREEMEANRAAQEADVAGLIGRYEQTLGQTRQERTDLTKELTQQKTDLQDQLEQREIELTGEKDRIAAELDQIRSAQEEEKLILAQIISLYERVIEDLQKVRYDKAIGNLNTLQSYINQKPVAALKAVQDRQHVELFLIGSLKKLIGLERMLRGYNVRNLIASSQLLSAVNTQVQEGDRSFDTGDPRAARQSYREAIDTIPAVQRSYARLREIESQPAGIGHEQFLQTIRRGDELYAAGDYEGSVEIYRTALGGLDMDSETAGRILTRTMDAGYRIGAARDGRGRSLALQRLNKIDNTIKAVRSDSGRSSQPTQETLVSLLEAKVLVKQILDSDSIKSLHPDLYERMEQYFSALGEEQRFEGYESGVTDANTIIDVVHGTKQDKALASLWERDLRETQGETLARLVGRLRSLLE